MTHIHNHPFVTLGILFSTLSTGCMVEDLDIGSELRASCPPEECGNTDHGNMFPATEINQDGQWSAQGFRLLGYMHGDTSAPLTVDVHDGEFYVLNGSGQWEPLGGEIPSLIIVLERDNGHVHLIRVEPSSVQLESWVDGQNVPMSVVQDSTIIPSYYVTVYNGLGPSGSSGYQLETSSGDESGWQSFCSPGAAGLASWPPPLGVLIAGERYDLDSREVLPHVGGEDRWFNIVCEGGALFKNKLLGYDPEFMTLGVLTTPDQRQATWKMMNADYCGDGISRTTNDTPLMWQNQYGWFIPPQGSLEAAWGPDGALCLDNPRHPELWDSNDCTIPACNGVVPGGAMWWTANPPTQ